MASFHPTRRHRDALQAIAGISRGVRASVDPEQAEECCSRGWAVPAAGANQYRLTEAGREVLARTGETGRPS